MQHSYPNGLTVKELKRIIADWPEEDAYGEDTEVWIGGPNSTSSQAHYVWPLNDRTVDGYHWADILLEVD